MPISQSMSTSIRTTRLACTRSRLGMCTWGLCRAVCCNIQSADEFAETSSARRSFDGSLCSQVLRLRCQRTRRMRSNSAATPSRTFHKARQTSNKFARSATRISERCVHAPAIRVYPGAIPIFQTCEQNTDLCSLVLGWFVRFGEAQHRGGGVGFCGMNSASLTCCPGSWDRVQHACYVASRVAP